MNIFHSFSIRSLKAHRARTIVTVIGIILSAAMLTAVTAMIASVRHYGIAYEEAAVGDWHVSVRGLNRQDGEKLKADVRTGRVYELWDAGYAMLEGGVNFYKPYLCVREMNAEFAAHMPVRLTEGRMPERENEVLIPDHVSFNGGVEIEPGETLILSVGYREGEDGQRLWQEDSLRVEEEDGASVVRERLVPEQKKVYTVVGIYERPSFENFSSPGYTVLALHSGETASVRYDGYFVLKRPGDAIGFWQEISGAGTYWSACNNALLRFYGYSVRSDFNNVLYGMGGVLIAIIVLGSVALIYNAFAISVSGRTKQFGLLSSVGATKKQMLQTVCYEAFVLCLIGIPAGIAAGICGIGVTLSAVSGPIEDLIGSEAGVEMRLFVSPASLAAAAAIGMVTVLISAYLPMRRALAVSAVDAVRQREDIFLTKKAVRVPGWVYRRFGTEGMIALKSFKRNRKRYQTTVLSLGLSILLFITAGSFSQYLFGSYHRAVELSCYDISVNAYGHTYDELVAAEKKIPEAEGTQPVYGDFYIYVTIAPEAEALTAEARRMYRADGADGVQETDLRMTAVISFLPEDLFAELLSYYRLSPENYADVSEPEVVVLNRILEYGEDGEEEISVFQPAADRILCLLEEDGGAEAAMGLKIGDIVENQVSDSPEFSERCCRLEGYRSWVSLVCPMSAAETVMNGMAENSSESRFWSQKLFVAKDHAQAAEEIRRLLDDDLHFSVYDIAENEDRERDMYVMINVFCYGFIVLISLISAANIFNTITTGIYLRRREFAMLKSIGMTPGEFVRMLNLECMIFGSRGLLTGFCFAVPCTALMYYLGNGASLEGFYLPWRYFVIAAACVFLVVFASMLYGQGRTGKESLVEALKE